VIFDNWTTPPPSSRRTNFSLLWRAAMPDGWIPIKIGEKPPPMWLRSKDDSYRQRVNGIVPGYGGHIPGEANKVGSSAHGAVSASNKQPLEMGQRATNSYRRTPMSYDHSSSKKGYNQIGSTTVNFQKSYRQSTNGIVPGYGGHIPNAIAKFGGSHEGQMPKPKHALRTTVPKPT